MTAQIEHYPKCKDCKWFNRTEHISYCGNPKFENKTVPDIDGMIAPEDSSGYDGNIQVGENFGCIHFEEKE